MSINEVEINMVGLEKKEGLHFCSSFFDLIGNYAKQEKIK
jgi:hypothetical protein